ncbi:MAG: endonuclease YncB(thermonuclease family) [Lysobacterales bacterium]|jgi:endonuclease YncB( thermonuclease family)
MSKLNAVTNNYLSPTYPALLKIIQSEIAIGVEALRRQKVQIYWNVGRCILDDLNTHKAQSNYGTKLMKRLSRDTQINERTLYELVKFAREFPKLNARSKFNWTQYRQLLGINDKDARLNIMRKIKDKKLTTRALQGEIKTINVVPPKPLVPKRGKLYTYTLINPHTHTKEKGFRSVDCGFNIYRKVPSVGLDRTPVGSIVKSDTTSNWFELKKSVRTKDDLYTYVAKLDHVVDGDTVVVELDLGFRTTIKQILRLRGINTPEIDTSEGKKAKQFVQKVLKDTLQITVRTYSRDIYGRYLADVFFGEKFEYLNQTLLSKSLAEYYR